MMQGFAFELFQVSGQRVMKTTCSGVERVLFVCEAGKVGRSVYPRAGLFLWEQCAESLGAVC